MNHPCAKAHKKVLITGTSTGLGAGLAWYYLQTGHQVYGISRRNNDKLAGNPHFHYLSQDLADFEGMERKIGPLLKNIADLDLAILNAGILPEIKDMKDCSLEEIMDVMNVNVWSSKVLIDLMFANLKSIRQIAAISSGAAVNGSRGWNSYSISKAALNMLVRLYAREQPGTHFCSIAPGLVDTNMQEYIFSLPGDRRFSSLDKLKESKRSGKMPKPEEAAEVLARALEKAIGEESGSFLDVREMDLQV